MTEAYCMKCKTTRAMAEGSEKKEKTANNRDAIRGTCSKCGTTMYKFVKKQK